MENNKHYKQHTTSTFLVEQALAILGALAVLIMLTGCGTTRGWDFHIGARPISQVDDRQGLEPNKLQAKGDRY